MTFAKIHSKIKVYVMGLSDRERLHFNASCFSTCLFNVGKLRLCSLKSNRFGAIERMKHRIHFTEMNAPEKNSRPALEFFVRPLMD